MKPGLFVPTAATSVAAAAVLEWPVARHVFLAPGREFPGLSAEALCLFIALCTWALLFAVAFLVILRIPKSWHIAARAAAVLVVASALLTVGQMALVVSSYLLNFLCVAAKVCEASLFAEAVNISFSKHAFHSPLPELLLVVPIFVAIALAVSYLAVRKVHQSGNRHAA